MRFKTDTAAGGRWPTSCRCMKCSKTICQGDEYTGSRPFERLNDMPAYIVFHSRCLFELAAKTFEATDIRFEEIRTLYLEGKVNVQS